MEQYFVCATKVVNDKTYFQPAKIIRYETVLSSLRGSFDACYMSVNPVVTSPLKNDKGNYYTTFDSGNFIAKNYLFEFDDMELKDQLKFIQKLKEDKVVGRVVYSGKKSVHAIIQTNHICSTPEEYKFVWNKLRERYFNNVKPDEACSNISRWSRCPNHIREATGKNQELLYWDLNVVLNIDDIVNEYSEYKNKQGLFRQINKHKSPFIKTNNDYHNLPSYKKAITAGDNEREKALYAMLYAMRELNYSNTDMRDALDEASDINGLGDKNYEHLLERFELKYE